MDERERQDHPLRDRQVPEQPAGVGGALPERHGAPQPREDDEQEPEEHPAPDDLDGVGPRVARGDRRGREVRPSRASRGARRAGVRRGRVRGVTGGALLGARVDRRDDLLHRRVLDGQVLQPRRRQGRRDDRLDRRHRRVDLEDEAVRGPFADRDPGQLHGDVRLDRRERHDLAPDVAAPQRRDGLVDQQPPPVDHQHAVAHALHVARVVRGEQQRAAVLHRPLAHEVADDGLRRDVEPDRRLVEEQEVRGVEQARHELAAHALAERERAHGLRHDRADPERLDQAVAPLPVHDRVLVVDVAQERERVEGGEVPPELAALPEDRADAVAEGRAGPPRGRGRGPVPCPRWGAGSPRGS